MKQYLSRRAVVYTMMASALVGILLPSRAHPQPQPNMQAALEALQRAHRELEQASENKGGHRVKAMELVQQAIAEVQKGMQFERRN